MSPYSTLGKSYGEQATVDLLHDKWADLMDKYLDTRFRSSSAHVQSTSINEKNESIYQRDASTGKRNKPIRLHDPNVSTTGSKKSRCQSPNDGSFSYLYSGRDDFQSASATSFKEINRQSTSPYHHLAQQYQRAPHRYPSPHHSVTSPTRHVHNRPQSQTNRYSNVPAEISSKFSSFYSLLLIFLLVFSLLYFFFFLFAKLYNMWGFYKLYVFSTSYLYYAFNNIGEIRRTFIEG